MPDRPILLSAPMVRALLAGRKSQTRRVIKDAPEGEWFADRVGPAEWRWVAPEGRPTMPIRLPCAPGDRLRVREAWRSKSQLDHMSPSEIGAASVETGWRSPWCPIHYEADGARDNWDALDPSSPPGRRRAAMHMPRWASRLTLLVTDVRVQRVQDISDEDALAEGVEEVAHPRAGQDIDIDGNYWAGGPKRMFRDLWDSLNGKRPGAAWSDNPWVAAYSFTVEKPHA